MKEYKRLVIWLDYFNSVITRGQGRRVSLNQAVRNPTLEELTEASKRLKYNPEAIQAFHPKRSLTQSGYVSIERKKPKGEVLAELASLLPVVRGERKKQT
ncbi:MAG: signal recognition particle subunit SRP19/SEC65 family protein [Candidatus Geothermarchaeales archaeon]